MVELSYCHVNTDQSLTFSFGRQLMFQSDFGDHLPSTEPPPGYSIVPGGSRQIEEVFNRRRVPVRGAAPFGLPSSGCNLLKSFTTAVDPSEMYCFSFTRERSGWSKRLDTLASEFVGQTEAECLHAYCIAHLRRVRQPEAARILFLRLWREYDEALLEMLPPRWLISAMTTFAEHGDTPVQRVTGTAFSVFFGMLKLSEFERRISMPKPARYGRYSDIDSPMPVGLGSFSLPRGDLDIAILGRLGSACDNDDLTGPIGRALLDRVYRDPGTMFARFAKVKDPALLAVATPVRVDKA